MADLIFITTEEGGIVTTLSSIELRKQKLQTPSSQDYSDVGPLSTVLLLLVPTKPIPNATSSGRLSYTTPVRVSYRPLGPHSKLQAPTVVGLWLCRLFHRVNSILGSFLLNLGEPLGQVLYPSWQCLLGARPVTGATAFLI